MGYTHYIKKSGKIGLTRWNTFLCKVEQIVDASDVKVNYLLNQQFIDIRSNEGSENLMLKRTAAEDFIFCKTNRESYDKIVSAVLILIDEMFGSKTKFIITSDGNIQDDEWKEAYELYISLFGKGCLSRRLYQYLKGAKI